MVSMWESLRFIDMWKRVDCIFCIVTFQLTKFWPCPNCNDNFSVAQMIQFFFNPLPNDKYLDRTKLKAFAENKLNIVVMMIFFFDRVENTMEKEKMVLFSIFSFSKAFVFRIVKSRHCVVSS